MANHLVRAENCKSLAEANYYLVPRLTSGRYSVVVRNGCWKQSWWPEQEFNQQTNDYPGIK